MYKVHKSSSGYYIDFKIYVEDKVDKTLVSESVVINLIQPFYTNYHIL